MTEFTKLTPSYQGGEFAKPEHVIEVQEAFAPIESELADHEARVTAAEGTLVTQGNRVTAVEKVTPLVRQPNYVAALGDSITIGSGSIEQDLGPSSYFTWLAAASGGVLLPLINGSRGIAGQTSTQIAARVGDIVALTPKPSRCFVMAGTNDCNGSLNMTTYKNNIQTIVTALRTALIEPVLLLIPPRSTNATEVATINAWLSLYGSLQGTQVIDLYTPFQDGTTGGWRSGYEADGIHPTSATGKLMGELIWSQIKDRIQPKSPVLLTAHASDPYNLVTNGVFVGDSNADGTANSWTPNGFTTEDSLVSGGSTVPGNWQKATLSTTGSIFWSQAISGWAVGDVLVIAARIRASVSGSELYQLGMAFTDGTPGRWRPILTGSVPTSGADGQIFLAVGKVPPGTTVAAVQLLVTGASSTGAVEFAQVTVRNLTALGLA